MPGAPTICTNHGCRRPAAQTPIQLGQLASPPDQDTRSLAGGYHPSAAYARDVTRQVRAALSGPLKHLYPSIASTASGPRLPGAQRPTLGSAVADITI